MYNFGEVHIDLIAFELCSCIMKTRKWVVWNGDAVHRSDINVDLTSQVR